MALVMLFWNVLINDYRDINQPDQVHMRNTCSDSVSIRYLPPISESFCVRLMRQISVITGGAAAAAGRAPWGQISVMTPWPQGRGPILGPTGDQSWPPPSMTGIKLGSNGRRGACSLGDRLSCLGSVGDPLSSSTLQANGAAKCERQTTRPFCGEIKEYKEERARGERRRGRGRGRERKRDGER